MNKATKHESERRVTYIVSLIINGISSNEIVQHITDMPKEQNWGVCERQIRKYIAKSQEYFKTESQVNRNSQIGLAAKRYSNLYAKSMRIKDYKTCLNIQKELCRLFGLNAPTKIESTGDITVGVNNIDRDLSIFTDAELRKIINEVEGRKIVTEAKKITSSE